MIVGLTLPSYRHACTPLIVIIIIIIFVIIRRLRTGSQQCYVLLQSNRAELVIELSQVKSASMLVSTS